MLPTDINSEIVHKILIINMMYIGDMLFMTPMLEELHKQYPDAQIDVLCDQSTSDLLRHHPYVSQIHAIDKRKKHKYPWQYLSICHRLRQEDYQTIINLHPNQRSSLIAALSKKSKACRLIGYFARGIGWMADQAYDFDESQHLVLDYLKVIQSSRESISCPLRLEISPEDQSQAGASMQHLIDNHQSMIIGLNPGGSWPTKRWLVEHWAGLADVLIQRGYRVVFFGGGMADGQIVSEIRSQMSVQESESLLVLTGQLSLLELAGCMRYCDLLVSGDSGPLHIALSQGTNVLGIYGPSSQMRFYPWGQREHMISFETLDCLGCGLHKCSHHSCMRLLDISHVLQRIELLLGTSVNSKS